ncbi:hypothetical protein JN531_017280 (plasmid) [Flagellatimonas centrodinii]|uniref:hypothetical protein n=1 Tax=Flagellatimonas centrodinii TaxID=2806210 RepID=UPI001FEDA886|nr:hypothetical protein [Flagellatimonas centrodinii]ULQ48386.1 hypothetical protein JN531_017280 [Flagellatimonas centrodinii]
MRPFAAVLLSLFASGCAHLSTYNSLDALSEDRDEVMVLDAKTRVVHSRLLEPKDSLGRYRHVVCAEPSPDALSALIASADTSVPLRGDNTIAAAVAYGESAASIGLRTQSIQLMRDSMYRLCESYLNGAISEASFETLQRRFQSSMVAILAIEQLTGAVRAPAVVLGGSAGNSALDQVELLTDKTVTAQAAVTAADGAAKAAADAAGKHKTEKLAAAEKALSEAEAATPVDQTKAEAAKAALEVVKTEQGKLDKASADAATAVKLKKEALAHYEELLLAAKNGIPTVSATGQLEVISGGAQRDLTAVAAAVHNIAVASMNREFGDELCTTVLARHTAGDKVPDDGSPAKVCHDYLSQTVAHLKVGISNLSGSSGALGAIDTLSREQIAILTNPQADGPAQTTAIEQLRLLQEIRSKVLKAAVPAPAVREAQLLTPVASTAVGAPNLIELMSGSPDK